MIATLTHLENASTTILFKIHCTKNSAMASIIYMQPRSRGVGVFSRMQKCFGGQIRQNKIEPFFQDQHQCLATKTNYGPVRSLK